MKTFDQDPIYDGIMRWHYKNPEARYFPPHIQNLIDIMDRREDAQEAEFRVSIDPYELDDIRADLQMEGEAWRKRRDAEEQLAQYIREVYDSTQWQPLKRGARTLLELADSLDSCRKRGAVGLKPGGGTMIAWEEKCGQVRLCPDESREETQRLSEFYLPAMLDWVKAKPTRRIFYAVFTDHNFRPGQLATGKDYLFKKFSDWRTYRPHACPVSFRPNGYGMMDVIRSRKQHLEAPFKLDGALVIQEDPLSAGDDWNIHLNAFLMVEGQFSYKTAREMWGGNVHFQEIDQSPEALRASLREAIKYSAQIVPTKSEGKRHETDAPAMTEWPPLRWLEWWQAQGSFRRVRSFGSLYALHGKRWDAMDVRERVDLCAMAEIDAGAAGEAWKALADEQKNPIRRALVHGERLDMSLVEWIGSVSENANGSLWVDLIPGNNFSASPSQQRTTLWDSGRNATGPPGPYH